MDFEKSIEAYFERLAEAEETLREKKLQLEASQDALVSTTLQRSISHLEKMRSIYMKTVEMLVELKRLSRC